MENEDDARSPAQVWIKRCTDALKREKSYRKDGREYVDIYEGNLTEKNPFAILYSNTETLQPSVYNATPIPMVERKFKDADPVGKAAAEVATRTLKFLIAEEPLNFDPFDDLMQGAVLNALVTNRGLTRFRYHAQREGETYSAECVYGENVIWDKFFHGYARSWKKVPWIGFEHDVSIADFEKMFPETKGKLNLDFGETTRGDDGEDTITGETRQQLTGVRLVKFYEIWDKTSRKQIFVSPAYTDGILRENDDPLQLKGFFPVPRPLNFQRKITTLVPTPLYKQYEDQAKELNELTKRLRNIIKAVKVRGFYDSTVDGIEKVLDAEDNQLIPIENRQAVNDGKGGMDDLLWLMPFDKLVAAAQQLYFEREQCKQIIYEITGISDILRGASVASETATAQNIKNQWGTLRLKKLQKEVQRYVRDCLRLMMEIAATKFQQDTFQRMTSLPFLTAEQKQGLQLSLEMQMAQAAQQGQQPPPPPPEVISQLEAPTWEEILQLLRDDVLRDYKIDIETNSTIDAEAAQDKQDIAELLNALSQFLNGIAPLVEQGVMTIDVAKAILLTISRRYNFGSQLEDSLMAMRAPEPKADPKAEADAQKAQLENQRMEREAQLETQQLQGQMELEKMRMDIERERLAMEQTKVALEAAKTRNQLEFLTAKHQMEMQKLAMQTQANQVNAQTQLVAADAKAKEAAKPKPKAEA